MESSTSSDDEDLDKFREAIDTKFINNSIFQENKSERKSRNDKERLPSLRPVKDEQEQFNLLNVTPEFQKYVAKCLGDHIERKLEKQLSTEVEYLPKKKRRKGGIKLFSDSKEYLSLKDNTSGNAAKLKKVEIKRRTIENDSDFTDDVKIKLCAVNSNDILSKKELKYWTERRRSEVFNYKHDKNGKLVCVEKEFE